MYALRLESFVVRVRSKVFVNPENPADDEEARFDRDGATLKPSSRFILDWLFDMVLPLCCFFPKLIAAFSICFFPLRWAFREALGTPGSFLSPSR